MTTVTICASLKFAKEIEEAKQTLEKKFCIVHTPITSFTKEDIAKFSEEELQKLHEVHYAKIEQSDYILVVNVNGYIGCDTLREIFYAIEHKIPVRYISSEFVFSNEIQPIALRQTLRTFLECNDTGRKIKEEAKPADSISPERIKIIFDYIHELKDKLKEI